MRHLAPLRLATVLCLSAVLPSVAHAEGAVVRQVLHTQPLGSDARPMVNPLAPPPAAAVRVDDGPDARQGGRSLPRAAGTAARAGTRAFGSFGIPYTSVRVMDGPAAAGATQDNRLSTTYPYRTVGKLDFAVGTDSAWCSASLIMRSVLVTAAHCAGFFGSNALYSGWTFRPGFFAGTQAQREPFGAWTTETLAVPPTWLNGRNTGRWSARNNDLAVFIVSKDDAGQFIGDVVGWMSYGWNNYSFTRSTRTKNMWMAATTTLGYPFHMDEGNIMQRADGPTMLTTVGRAKQMWQGTNFTGGSSGGPWVVNLGYSEASLNDGAEPGTASALNVVIGVTSWGTADPNVIKDNYASQFAQNKEYPAADYGGYGAGNIGALLQALCTTVKPGGSQTYAALGYCDN